MPIVPQINILQMKIEEAAACLEERSIGAKLLAQGLCTTHPIGRFLSFCQLFENAFRTPFEQLTEILSEFLQGNNLDYSADEVSVWVDTRGAAAHGDLKKARMIADEHAVRQFLDRMQQAAYDALMNKLNWHQKDAARREAWHPGTASKAKLGELVFVAGKPTNFRLRPMDPFTNWPVASDCRLEKSGDAVMPSVNVQMPMQLEVRPGPLEPEIGIL